MFRSASCTSLVDHRNPLKQQAKMSRSATIDVFFVISTRWTATKHKVQRVAAFCKSTPRVSLRNTSLDRPCDRQSWTRYSERRRRATAQSQSSGGSSKNVGDLARAMGGGSAGSPAFFSLSRTAASSVTSRVSLSLPPQGQAKASTHGARKAAVNRRRHGAPGRRPSSPKGGCVL